MSEPFIGEVIMFGGNFAPRGWAFCQGQLLAIAQNTALFSILGTTYGGNGQTTFALPDFRGRVPVGTGQGPGLSSIVLGEVSGTQSVTLLNTNLPAHNHGLTHANAKPVLGARTEASNATAPNGAFLGSGSVYVSGQAAANAALNVASIKFGNGAVTELSTGGNQPFSILQPYLGISFIIAIEGIFPSRN